MATRKESGDAGTSADVDTTGADSEELVSSVAATNALDLLHQAVADRARQGVDPETAAMDRIIGSILTADTIEGVLGENTPLKAKELLGIPLTIHGISFMESDVEESRIPFYATFHGVRHDTGVSVVVNCGGEQVLAQALWLDANAEWPVIAKFIEVGKEKTGRNRPLRLAFAGDVRVRPQEDRPF